MVQKTTYRVCWYDDKRVLKSGVYDLTEEKAIKAAIEATHINPSRHYFVRIYKA